MNLHSQVSNRNDCLLRGSND